MINNNYKLKIHIKNNRWAEGTFPNTPEGEKVFTITEERLKTALVNFPDLKDRIESFIDWDEDNFIKSIARIFFKIINYKIRKISKNTIYLNFIEKNLK